MQARDALRAGVVSPALADALSEILEDMLDSEFAAQAAQGRKPRPMSWRLSMAVFSAAVTALKGSGSVDTALAIVARAGGVSKGELRTFRDRINRGLADSDTFTSYTDYLKILRHATPAEIERHVTANAKRLRDFCT